MRLKETFVSEEIAGEYLLIPVGSEGFRGIVQGNGTFRAILDALAEETTERRIVDSLLARYDAPEETVAKDVRGTLKKLREIGALED